MPRYDYLIATLGVVLPILALKLSGKTKIKFALLITSTVFALYLSEFALVLLTPEYNLVAARREGVPFDARTKLEVVEDLRAQGVDAYPSAAAALHPDDGRLNSLGGVSGKNTVLCNESGTYVVYESDEHGFNNPQRSWTKQPDVAMIGDSYTQGFCAQSPQDMAGQLRGSGLGVLNLGILGSGPLKEFAIFREYAKPLQPRVVLWIYFEGNDLDDLDEEKKSPLLMRYYLDDNFSQDLMHRQDEADRNVKEYVDARMRDERLKRGKVSGFTGFYNHLAASEVGRGITLVRTRTNLADLFHHRRPDFSLLGGVLQKSRDLSSSWGGQLYFVYLPGQGRYASKVDEGDYRHRREVLSMVNGLNIPVIDVHSVFAAHPDPLSLFPFRLYNHYGPEGHRLAAQTIEQALHHRR